MDTQRGVVGCHDLRLACPVMAPQRQPDEVFSLSWRIVAQPVDASLDLEPGATPGMVVLLSISVSGLQRLSGGEVSSLG